MKVRWARSTRVPRLPGWATVLVGLWLLLVLAGVLLEQWGGPVRETCLFHRFSGHPCPTCGSTRVVMGFARGEWAHAFRWNPLVALGLLVGALGLGVRLITGHTLQFDLSPRQQRLALGLGLATLLLNWVWVLRTQA